MKMRSTLSEPGTNDSQTPDGESAGERECSQCSRRRPLTLFRWNRKRLGQRHRICRDCRRAQDKVRHVQRDGQDARRFVTLLHRTRTTNEDAALVSEMLKRFGGVNPLADQWMAEFCNAPVGSSFRSRTFQAVVELCVGASQDQLDVDELHQALDIEVLGLDRDIQHMTEEELMAEAARLETERGKLAAETEQKAQIVMSYLARLHADGYLATAFTAMLDNKLLILSAEDREMLATSLDNVGT